MNYANKEKFVTISLTWYFFQSYSDCGGICSNFNLVVRQAQLGRGGNFNNYSSERRFNAICRKQEIEKIFFKLPIKIQNILYASFGGDHRFHPLVEAKFQKLVGCAYMTCSQKELESLCQKAAHSGLTPNEKIRLTQLTIVARNLYQSAIDMYFNQSLNFQETDVKNAK